MYRDKNDFVGDTKESQFKIMTACREIDNNTSPRSQPVRLASGSCYLNFFTRCFGLMC